jgi:hypothetical protein
MTFWCEMASRVVGYIDQERRRDRRRAVIMPATLDGQDIRILDIGLSGFGADGAFERHDKSIWPETGARAELAFTDYKSRDMLMLVEITSADHETGRFGGSFIELSGLAFNVIEDLMLHRDLRAAAQ